MKWNEMKTEMKKKMNQRKKFIIVEQGVMNEFEEKNVWKMDKNSLKYGVMVDWKNLGFEHEGNGKLCYTEFEPINAS